MGRPRSRPLKLPQRLTREEAARLLAAPNKRCPSGVRNRAILRLLYRSGLRAAELCALTPRDVQLSRTEIRVNEGKGAKDRVVWIDETTAEVLDRWKEIRPRSDWFFCTLERGREGRQLDTSYLRHMIGRMGKRAGIEIRCYPHLLRHTYASELIEEGYDPVQVQKMMGHASLQSTQIYAHVADEGLREKLKTRPG